MFDQSNRGYLLMLISAMLLIGMGVALILGNLWLAVGCFVVNFGFLFWAKNSLSN